VVPVTLLRPVKKQVPIYPVLKKVGENTLPGDVD